MNNGNYLARRPKRAEHIQWTTEGDNVILKIENRGFFNRTAQKLLKKPKITYVHLDETGSFVWMNIDGAASVADIGGRISDKFGEKANPLYERLVKYLWMLESYHFITWY